MIHGWDSSICSVFSTMHHSYWHLFMAVSELNLGTTADSKHSLDNTIFSETTVSQSCLVLTVIQTNNRLDDQTQIPLIALAPVWCSAQFNLTGLTECNSNPGIKAIILLHVTFGASLPYHQEVTSHIGDSSAIWTSQDHPWSLSESTALTIITSLLSQMVNNNGLVSYPNNDLLYGLLLLWEMC